jgi:hypothetical protein|tara:strand:- start:21 stop:233 length:213 start_codon:yes stop_codon:yes gene_type:complete
MSEYIQVEGHSNLLRDEGSTAIVNSDRNSYELHKKRRESFVNQKNEINTLKNEVSDMKQMIHTIIEKLNG